ncbi:MAG TPA: phosphate-starvation-inducible PsiE family protein [Cryptosporangiaceae bacterium]|nr:phosphate-starvation-inducible PsiE family protein [Cryptosporangiaceae bacterium]
MTAPETEAERESSARRWLGGAMDSTLVGFESVLYAIVGLLLIVAAGFVLVGTVQAVVQGFQAGDDVAEIGVVLLDRILLALIVAELAYSLRYVMQTHEITAEPFLFIGLIATVRRILIVTAEFERPAQDVDLTILLYELGLLALLTVGLAVAIFLVRRSARQHQP